MDEGSCAEHYVTEVVLVVTPLVKILGVDESSFILVGNYLDLRSFIPLGEGVDGWHDIGRCDRVNEAFVKIKI